LSAPDAVPPPLNGRRLGMGPGTPATPRKVRLPTDGLTPRGCQRWPRVFGHTSSIAFPEAERTVGDREFGRDGQPAPLQVEQPSASAFGIVGIGPGRDGQFGLGPAPLSGDRTRNVQCLKRRPANLCRRSDEAGHFRADVFEDCAEPRLAGVKKVCPIRSGIGRSRPAVSRAAPW
jgi:hypothetical protein